MNRSLTRRLILGAPALRRNWTGTEALSFSSILPPLRSKEIGQQMQKSRKGERGRESTLSSPRRPEGRQPYNEDRSRVPAAFNALRVQSGIQRINILKSATGDGNLSRAKGRPPMQRVTPSPSLGSPVRNLKGNGSVKNLHRRTSRKDISHMERRSKGRPKILTKVATAPPTILHEAPSRFRLSEIHHLEPMNYSARGRWSDLLSSPSLTFASSLQAGLASLGISTPNPMQLSTIPRLLKPKARLLCAAETGSGKTLAYLVPLLCKLKAEEIADPAVLLARSRPRSLILVPSNELVEQVHAIAKHLSHHVKLRMEKLSGSQGRAARMDALSGAIDVVVGTPAQVLGKAINLEGLRHLVIDEGDTLLSDDFGEQIKQILRQHKEEQCKKMDGNMNENLDVTTVNRERDDSSMTLVSQLDTIAICSATIPISLTRSLDELFPGIERLGSPKLHAASDRVDVRFVDARLSGNAKFQLCAELLVKHSQKTTLIFCNTTSHATRLHRWLSENQLVMEHLLGGAPSLLHGRLPEPQRCSIMRRFQMGDIRYLVCTDLVSRGLDTTMVGHVIMFEFARNVIDFIHRAGRTGRLQGSRGLVSCLVSSRDTALAKAIKQSIKSNQSLTSPK